VIVLVITAFYHLAWFEADLVDTDLVGVAGSPPLSTDALIQIQSQPAPSYVIARSLGSQPFRQRVARPGRLRPTRCLDLGMMLLGFAGLGYAGYRRLESLARLFIKRSRLSL
jgi:hypothetical protein